MKATPEMAKTMIETYDWAIDQLSDISLYGPPTRHVHYLQLYGIETREHTLRTDIERRQHWVNILNGGLTC